MLRFITLRLAVGERKFCRENKLSTDCRAQIAESDRRGAHRPASDRGLTAFCRVARCAQHSRNFTHRLKVVRSRYFGYDWGMCRWKNGFVNTVRSRQATPLRFIWLSSKKLDEAKQG